MAKITCFEVGYCTHIGCMVVKGAGLRVCKFPARTWLLEVGERRWLWDTGYASWFERYTRSGIFRAYPLITPVKFDPQEALVNQLANVGLTGRDLRGIILSHFHADHIAGLRDFPAVPFICSAKGWQQVRKLRGFAALRQGFVPGLIPPEFESSVQFIESFPRQALPATLTPFAWGYVLPGSEGQILLVPLAGHAAGHIGAFVLTDEGWTLLAADAAWAPANYQQMRLPSRLARLLMSDTAAWHHTLDKLNQLYQKGVTIRLSHEGDM